MKRTFSTPQARTSAKLTRPLVSARELFRIGYRLDEKGHSRAAEVVYQNAIAFLETRTTGHQGDLSDEQIAQAALYHGKNLYALGRFDLARGALHEAIERYTMLLQGNVVSLMSERLAVAFRVLGMTQYRLGELERSYLCYLRAIAIWRSLLLFIPRGPKKDAIQRQLGMGLFRCGKVLVLLKRPEEARIYFVSADALLRLTSETKHFTLNASIAIK